MDSRPGKVQRKLPDKLLRSLQVDKRGFVRDWMCGYINLATDGEDFFFTVSQGVRFDDKKIRIEYVGVFDALGAMIGGPREESVGKI